MRPIEGGGGAVSGEAAVRVKMGNRSKGTRRSGEEEGSVRSHQRVTDGFAVTVLERG